VKAVHEKFVRDRITELRLRKNVSEYQMSSDLGRSSGYLYNISSGKALPSLRELFAIVEYFGITLSDFFDEQNHYPDLITEAVRGMSDSKELLKLQ
jgi:transcriptional regulator with XRE-family HTH domain